MKSNTFNLSLLSLKMSLLKHIPLLLMLTIWILPSYSTHAQDLIVTTNGLEFKAKVVAVEKDSVKYVNRFDPTKKVLSVPKSQLKHIEYFNGDFDYFQGSYTNLSEKDSTEFITGIEYADHSVMVEAIVFSISNYFTENHLIIDFSGSLDSNLMAEKGRIEFEFENLKHNFTMRSYKADDKTLYSKFSIGSGNSKKRYRKLSEKSLEKIRIYSGEAIVDIRLSPSNSTALRKLFKKSRID